MADSTTTNYGLTKPEVGASEDTWGAKVNTDMDLIDTQMKASANAIVATVAVANAALPKAGGTMTGDTAHGDNVKAKFGTGDDLQIYHNGVNSYINSTTGSLYIRDSAGDIYIQAKNNENSIVANNDGSVQLYYDNAQKLATTSTGVDVTGTVTADNLQVSGTGVSDLQRSHSTTTASLAVLDIKAKSTGDMAAGFGSAARFIIEDTANVENVVAEIAARRESSDSTAALTFTTSTTEKMRIDSSGNVGIGVVPEAWNASWTALQLGATGFVGQYQSGVTDVTALGSNVWSDGSYKYIETDQAAIIKLQNGTMIFDVAASGTADAAISFTTAMTINNAGTVLIGSNGASPSSSQAGISLGLSGPSGGSIAIANTLTSTYAGAVKFINGNGQVGHIATSGSATTYATSSDYRLKTDVQPMTGAADRVKLLKPCNFEWIVDGTRVDGFIAHEAQEVVPEAVTGTKDAMMDAEYEVTPAVVDDEGVETTAAVMGTRSVPDMQGIDQAKLVPLLTATIQELIARIEALEA